jgi:hypothetical protein
MINYSTLKLGTWCPLIVGPDISYYNYLDGWMEDDSYVCGMLIENLKCLEDITKETDVYDYYFIFYEGDDEIRGYTGFLYRKRKKN